MTAKIASKIPWSVPVRRDDVPETGLHRELVAELANLPHRNGEVFRRPDGKPTSAPVATMTGPAGPRLRPLSRRP